MRELFQPKLDKGSSVLVILLELYDPRKADYDAIPVLVRCLDITGTCTELEVNKVVMFVDL